MISQEFHLQALKDWHLFNSSGGGITLNDSMDGEGDDVAVQPPGRGPLEVLIWTTMYALVIFIGFFGNLIVVWIVAMHASMRSVTNYFLVNLSISDMMYTTLNIPWFFAANLNGEWPFGSDVRFCKVVRLVAPLSAAASIFSLTAISIDRYLAIVNPLSHQLTKKRAWIGIIAIWVLASATAYPQFHYSTIIQPDPSSQVRNCLMIFPDGMFGKYFLATKIVQAMIYLVIPGTVISWAYVSVAKELWNSGNIGESQNLRQIRSKKKIVKMMITIVIVFNLTMTPAHLVLIVIGLNNSVLEHHTFMNYLWLLVTLLANSNTVYNPLIYCYMNKKFRRGFQNFFRVLVCKKRVELDQPTVKNGVPMNLKGGIKSNGTGTHNIQNGSRIATDNVSFKHASSRSASSSRKNDFNTSHRMAMYTA